MPIAVSEYLGLSRVDFESTGAFNAILDRDSRLFIDPLAARNCSIPEFASVNEKILKRFSHVLILLKKSSQKGDLMWRTADKQLVFPEKKGTCLGYSTRGTSGRGMGPKIRADLLQTAKSIVDADIEDPEVFELLAFFEKDVGCDLISDMITTIIWSDLLKYSARIFASLKTTKKVSVVNIPVDGERLDLPLNPYNQQAIVLVPEEILQDLPVAIDFEDIDYVCSRNAEVREIINRLIVGGSLSDDRKPRKPEIKRLLLENPDLLKEVLAAYKNSQPKRYDFAEDRSGQVNWVWAAKEQSYPIDLQLPMKPTLNDVQAFVIKICNQFKDVVEKKGLWRLLYYNRDGRLMRKKEEAAQLLFYGVAVCYCDANGMANDVDVSPETDAGRGPVDFKFSRGRRLRVLVEIKLSTNTRLVHGLTKQLPTYMESEGTDKGIYLIVDFRSHDSRVSAVYAKYGELSADEKAVLFVFRVDASQKLSASIPDNSLLVAEEDDTDSDDEKA
jgi:hypothetical protein